MFAEWKLHYNCTAEIRHHSNDITNDLPITLSTCNINHLPAFSCGFNLSYGSFWRPCWSVPVASCPRLLAVHAWVQRCILEITNKLSTSAMINEKKDIKDFTSLWLLHQQDDIQWYRYALVVIVLFLNVQNHGVLLHKSPWLCNSTVR